MNAAGLVIQLAGYPGAHFEAVQAGGDVFRRIGEVTGMPEGTVKNYLFRARNLLKEKVKKYLGKEQLL